MSPSGRCEGGDRGREGSRARHSDADGTGGGRFRRPARDPHAPPPDDRGAASAGNAGTRRPAAPGAERSEEHTSELQSLMRISYAVFCLKKNTLISIIATHLNHVYSKSSETQ